MKYVIYTDGGCIGNPGPGGIGILVFDARDMDNPIAEISENHCEETTNNRMELLACIEALKRYGDGDEIKIYTDSTYVKKGITEWIHNWVKNNWRKKSFKKKEDPQKKLFPKKEISPGKLVKNQDLWKELHELNSPKVSWNWVRGHQEATGGESKEVLRQIRNNDIVDVLANNAARGYN